MASTQVSNGVFISYRRRGGSELAQLLKEFLTSEGFDVFLDVVKLRAGQFDKQLLDEIERRPNFLFIHSKNALSSCKKPKDWVRKELACALKSKRRIIPILLKGASFPKPGSLPRILAEFEQQQRFDYNHDVWEETKLKLVAMLKGSSKRKQVSSTKTTLVRLAAERPIRLTLATSETRFEVLLPCFKEMAKSAESMLSQRGGAPRSVSMIEVRRLTQSALSQSVGQGALESIRASNLLFIDVSGISRDSVIAIAGIALGMERAFHFISMRGDEDPQPPLPSEVSGRPIIRFDVFGSSNSHLIHKLRELLLARSDAESR